MEKRAGKVFMTIRPDGIIKARLRIIFVSTLALILIFSQSCDPDTSDDPIPYVPFQDVVINLTLPSNIGLASDGGYMYVNGGVRGLIIYRKTSTSYIAYERNCTYHPNEAGSTVDLQPQFQRMYDSFCGSAFRFEDGRPIEGPATRNLQQYQTTLSGTTLTITDQIVDPI